MTQLTSTLSSLLMSLPLIAVPCLAIFGLPTADSDAAPEEEVGIDLGVPSGLGEATSSHSHDGHSHDSPFGPFRNAGGEQVSANTAGDRSEIAPTSGFQGAAANAAAGLNAEAASSETHDECCPPDHAHGHAEHGHHHAEEPSDTLGPTGNPFADEDSAESAAVDASGPSPSSGSDPGWDAALTQLRTLGVKQFHLTNSDIPGEFFFCCSLRTSRNILQRFEAEAATPVAAARDVLAQVESWQSTR